MNTNYESKFSKQMYRGYNEWCLLLANYVLTDPRPQPADWSKQIQSERHWERSSARFELVYYHTMFGWFLNHGPPLYFLAGREAQRRALGVVVRCLHLVACGAAPPLVSSS